MRLSKVFILVTATACATQVLPVRAANEADAFDRVDPSRMIGRALDEESVSLLFGYIRESLAAGAEGRTPEPPPEELTRRMDEAGRALRREGSASVLSILAEFERELKRTLRDEFGNRPSQAP